jgi:hypothetical protein
MEDTLAIPNLLQNILEIVRIVVAFIDDDDVLRLVPLCTLGLPPLSAHASIIRLCCHAEPNPTSSNPLLRPAPSSRPFRDNAADAIVLFNLLIEEPEHARGPILPRDESLHILRALLRAPRAHSARAAAPAHSSAPSLALLRRLWYCGLRVSSQRCAGSNSTLRRCAGSRRLPDSAWSRWRSMRRHPS